MEQKGRTRNAMRASSQLMITMSVATPQHDPRTDKADHPHADELSNLIQVVRQSRHEIARVHVAVKALVERLQVRERIISQFVFEKPRHTIDRGTLDKRE